MATLEQSGSTHECFATLLFDVDPGELIRIACKAANITSLEIARIAISDPRIEVPGLFTRAKRHTIDAVFTTYDVDDKPTSVWVLEIQLSEDRTKVRRWVFYPLAFAVQLDADGHQVLLIPEPRLRERIRRMIRDVVPRPILIQPRHIEPITDYDDARRRPQLTILSALYHVHPPAKLGNRVAAFRAAWIAVQTFANEQNLRYAHLVMSITPEAVVKRGIEQLRESGDFDERGYELFSETERYGSSFARGHKEGLEEGREEGLQELCRALRRGIVDVLELRGLQPTPTQRERIESCASVETLERWYAGAKSEQSVERALV